MSKSRNLGEFEILVMAALIRLGDNAYGVTIRQEIENRAGRTVTVGALYTTLARLEEKDFVSSRMGEATPERGGRAKRYFEITSMGRGHFERSVSSLGAMLKGLRPWPKTLRISM